MKTLLLSITTSALALAAYAGPFDGWNRKLEIAYTNYTGAHALTDFPVLVEFSEEVPGVYYEDFASATAPDLRFADGTSLDELAYEIDEWNSVGSSFVWVRVPVFTNGTILHAYWGNPGQTNAPAYATSGVVWTNGYLGVWHMKEAGNAPADGAPAGGDNSGTSAYQGSFRLTDGKVGAGYDYVNTGRVNISNATNLHNLAEATLTCWYYKRSQGGANHGTMFGRPDNNGGLRHHNVGGEPLDIRLDGVWVAGSRPLANGAWHFLAYTFDAASSRVDVFLNGEWMDAGNSGAASWLNPIYLVGSGNLADRAIDGIADELRCSSVVRSADWIKAAFLTTASNSQFGAYAFVEELDGDPGQPSVHTLAASDVAETTATLNGALASTGTAATTVSVYWGAEDGGTNAGEWAHAIAFPGVAAAGSFATNLAGLVPGTAYYCRFHAENVHGEVWARTSRGFVTLGPPIVESTGEMRELGYALLKGTVLANGAPTYATVYWGGTDGGTSAPDWEIACAFTNPVGGAIVADTRADVTRVPWGTGFSSCDAGVTGLAGGALQTNGGWTVTGSGVDIWNSPDGFHYASRPVYGDFDVSCRMGGFVGGTHENRKTALMLRESFDGGSRYVAVLRTPTNGSHVIRFARRTTVDGNTASAGPNDATNEYYWVRLVREGDDFSGYWAEDSNGVASAWNQIGGSVQVDLNTECSLGLAVSSHDNAQLTTVTFDGFSGDVPAPRRLLYGVPYYYRCYATNSYGARWADETEPFVTVPPAGIGVSNGTPSAVAAHSVTLNGLLLATQSVFEVVMLWGETDGGTDVGAWAHTNVVGSYTNIDSVALSSTLGGLTQKTWYGTFAAINAATNMLAAPSLSFQPLGVPVVSNHPVQNVTDSSATMNGMLTGGGEADMTVYYGLTDGGENVGGWAGSITVTNVLALETTPVDGAGLLAYGSYYCRWYASNSAGTAWADTSQTFTTAVATVTVSDGEAMESDDNSVMLEFPVTLSATSATPVSIDFATVDFTARAGTDYVATNGTLTIPAGEAGGTIRVRVVGDTKYEDGYETFRLELSSPTHCRLSSSHAAGAIHDDDLGEFMKGWAYCMRITFSGYTGSETLTNFPALIVFEPTMEGFAYNQLVSDTGDDLRFTDGDVLTMLKHDVEAWDTGGRSYVWVKVPELMGTDTTIWAYWGNGNASAPATAERQATWGGEFLGVYHLHADANDSTANRYDGTEVAGPVAVSGLVGGAMDFTGGALVDLGTTPRWDRIDNLHENAFTLSTWISPHITDADLGIFGRFPQQFLVWLDGGGGSDDNFVALVSRIGGGDTRTDQEGGILSEREQWQLVTVTMDGPRLTLYVNGVFSDDVNTTTGLPSATQSLILAGDGAGGKAMNGSLDEARIAAVCRSADWIKAEYANIRANSAFNTYDPAKATKPGMILIVR